MLFYLAFTFALALACMAGVLYFYVLFLESRIRQQQRRIAELERMSHALAADLEGAEALLAEERNRNGESWPELVDENNDYSMS